MPEAAAFIEEQQDSALYAPRWVARCSRTGERTPAAVAAGRSPLSIATHHAITVYFDGELHNAGDLARQLQVAIISPAALIARAYERWADELAIHLKGLFAIVVHDAAERRTLAIRDPLGAVPLFYADSGDRLLVSSSIDALRGEAGVPGGFNRAALADHLSHRWPDQHETFFAGVRRVPPGYQLVATPSALRVTRYWEPVPLDRPVQWLADDEVQARFDAAFERAVYRTLDAGPTGIFLSGGLDSISVAAMAADGARRRTRPLPLALSLGFPGDSDEEKEQRGVAQKLGLVHDFVGFSDAAPPTGLLEAALACTVQQPTPLLNTWMPAYSTLARRAKAQGIRAIMSGAGGDEWLAVSPFLAADLLRGGDVSGLATLMRAWARSYNMSPIAVAKCLLWNFGARPIASAAIGSIAPAAWTASRTRRGIAGTRGWVATGALRRELDDRVARYLPEANPKGGFYLRDVRSSLEHPLTVLELEEIYEHGRRLDVRFLHPYWDADVVDTLYRTPPLTLFAGGRSKSVVRSTMARRFPGLGLERQKKRSGTTFFRSLLHREVPELWKARRQLQALPDLGIVDLPKASAMADRSVGAGDGQGLVAIWDIINLETWARAHQ